MARDDPACLCEVSNFCVGRRGVGSVRWLEPVDVRELDLDATVQLNKGSIEASSELCFGCLRCRCACCGVICARFGGVDIPFAHPFLFCTRHIERLPPLPFPSRPQVLLHEANKLPLPACPTHPHPLPPHSHSHSHSLPCFPSHLSPQVYLNEANKPEVGRGLNKPAEVTMLKIYKLAKDTGRPTADPEAIDR